MNARYAKPSGACSTTFAGWCVRACSRAAEIASESCSPTTDNRGTAEYKRHLAGELTRRSLRLAVERIRAGAAGDQQRKG